MWRIMLKHEAGARKPEGLEGTTSLGHLRVRPVKMSGVADLKWEEPDSDLFVDHRPPENREAVAVQEEQPSPELESEDDRPLVLPSYIPTASDVTLPRWASTMTPKEKATHMTKPGELGARDAMTLQSWYSRMKDLDYDSEFYMKIKDLPPNKKKMAMID